MIQLSFASSLWFFFFRLYLECLMMSTSGVMTRYCLKTKRKMFNVLGLQFCRSTQICIKQNANYRLGRHACMSYWVPYLFRVYFRQFFRISTKARHNSGNPAEIFKLRLRGLSREFFLFKRTRMRRRYWWAIAVSFSESFLKSNFVPRNGSLNCLWPFTSVSRSICHNFRKGWEVTLLLEHLLPYMFPYQSW